jgi:predicted nucleic acid-binding protein
VTVYLDASALVKLVVREAETEKLVAYLRPRRSRATSVVGLVEVRRAAARRPAVPTDRVEAVLATVAAVGLDPALVAAAGAVRPTSLRTLDAIHLATAALLGDDLEAVVSYDVRLTQAAAEAGLPVTSPGA